MSTSNYVPTAFDQINAYAEVFGAPRERIEYENAAMLLEGVVTQDAALAGQIDAATAAAAAADLVRVDDSERNYALLLDGHQLALAGLFKGVVLHSEVPVEQFPRFVGSVRRNLTSIRQIIRQATGPGFWVEPKDIHRKSRTILKRAVQDMWSDDLGIQLFVTTCEPQKARRVAEAYRQIDNDRSNFGRMPANRKYGRMMTRIANLE